MLQALPAAVPAGLAEQADLMLNRVFRDDW